MHQSLLGPLVALPASIALTFILVVLCNRQGWVALPRADRWHQKPTALYGGVAIWTAVVAGGAVAAPALLAQHRAEFIGLAIGATLTFAIGLLDDIRPLNPLVKLTGQVVSCTVVLVGLGLAVVPQHSHIFMLALPVATLWMLGLTNAFNLLDNMDGLSAGTSAVIGAVLAVFLWLAGVPAMGSMCAAVSAACVGFLVFNFRPKGNALIFMGDCGSMVLGYLLAGLALVGAWKLGGHGVQAAAVPLLVMGVPIFDTTLVTIRRKLEGRPVSQGGRDHSSHRLVYSGFSEKQAVLVLHAISAILGATALLVWKLDVAALTIAAVVAALLGLGAFGVWLSRFRQPVPAATPLTMSQPARKGPGGMPRVTPGSIKPLVAPGHQN